MTVLGASDDDTIAEAVRGGELYGAEIVVDLLNVPDPIARARRSAELGAAAVCWHVGIDMQMQAKTPFERLEALAQASPIPVAVAGGLNSESVARATRARRADPHRRRGDHKEHGHRRRDPGDPHGHRLAHGGQDRALPPLRCARGP